MKYDFFSLTLLSLYEAYLPYMTEDDIMEILHYGTIPSPWKIREWESARKTDRGRIESALKAAISRQK